MTNPCLSDIYTHVNSVDTQAAKTNAKYVLDLGFKLDDIYHGVLGKGTRLSEKVIDLSNHGEELEVQVVHNAKTVGKVYDLFMEKGEDEPIVYLNMIDWVPYKEITFESSDSSSESNGRLLVPSNLLQ